MKATIAVLLIAGLAILGSSSLAQEGGKPEQAPVPAESGPTIDLQVLLGQVAESSGKKFVVEQRVPQTIHIGGIGLEDPTYATLLSILNANGLAAAEVGDYVHILPEAVIRQLPLPLVQRDDADIPADAWVSRVITVPNENAPWLVPILRPLIAQAGHLSTAPTPEGAEGSTKLLIVASYGKVKHITEIVELLVE